MRLPVKKKKKKSRKLPKKKLLWRLLVVFCVCGSIEINNAIMLLADFGTMVSDMEENWDFVERRYHQIPILILFDSISNMDKYQAPILPNLSTEETLLRILILHLY